MLENKVAIDLQDKVVFVNSFLKIFSGLHCFVFVPSFSGPVAPRNVLNGTYNKSMHLFFDLCNASPYRKLPIFTGTQNGCKEMLNYLINFNKNTTSSWHTHMLATNLNAEETIKSVLKGDFHKHITKDLDAFRFLSAYYTNDAITDPKTCST